MYISRNGILWLCQFSSAPFFQRPGLWSNWSLRRHGTGNKPKADSSGDDSDDDYDDNDSDKVHLESRSVILKVRKAIKKIRKSVQMLQKLRKCCEIYEMKYKVPKLDVKNRRNSTDDNIVDRVAYLKTPLRTLCNNEKTLTGLQINDDEWKLVNKIRKIIGR